ncbi:MAG: CbrC family protein, partial [Planctomycetales bacterium]
MGGVFTYIADEILAKYAELGRCRWCKAEVDLYAIYIEDTDCLSDQACIQCIKTLPLRQIQPKSNERIISSLINERYPKGSKSQEQRFALTVEMCDDYRRTPCLPNFIHHDDWPFCCGDFTEYIGDAGETHNGPCEEFEWWGTEDDEAKEHGVEGMMGEERVSLFQCLHCSSKH